MKDYEQIDKLCIDALFDCPTPYFTKVDLLYNLNKKFIVKDIDLLINCWVKYGVLEKKGERYKIALENIIKS